MAVNKVTYNGNTLIDLTGDSVTPSKLGNGVTAHDKAGNVITGTVPILGYIDGANIRLYGNLPKGTYPLVFENADGTIVEIGYLSLARNEIIYSINTDGTPFGTNGIVYGKRWSSSGTLSNGQANTTGLIACKAGDIIYLEKCGLYQGKANEAHRVTFWNTSKGILGYEQPFALKGTYMTNVQFENSFVTQFTVKQDGYFAVSGINATGASSAGVTDYLDENSKITIKSAS